MTNQEELMVEIQAVQDARQSLQRQRDELSNKIDFLFTYELELINKSLGSFSESHKEV